MFSVDTFYEFFISHYGHAKTGMVTQLFVPHGSKKLTDAWSFVKDPVLGDEIKNNAFTLFKVKGVSILHDQEHFSWNYALDTYRQDLVSANNLNTVNHSILNSYRGPQGIKQDWLKRMTQELTDEELFIYRWNTVGCPIWCHSELHSSDVRKLVDLGFIECHYFWHGLVSRDWFRHWRYHADLVPKLAYKKKFLMYARDCSGTRLYRSQVKSRLQEFKSQISHDWDEQKTVSSDASARIDVEDAADTAIHLVLETLFDQEKIHLTEKIFKPMVMQQPFIVFAPCNSLRYLRDYGFRTFSDLWDETYDSIPNAQARMDKIIDVIKSLHDLPDAEFQDIMCRANDIVAHNHRRFFSDQFADDLLTELHHNMKRAVQEQQHRSITDPGGIYLRAMDNQRRRGCDHWSIGSNISQLLSHGSTAQYAFGLWWQTLKIDQPDLAATAVSNYPWLRDIN